MGRASRDKGARRERQIVDLHTAMGIKAERVPLSGAARYQGNGADVDVYPPWRDAPLVAEVKARAGGQGFVTLERWLGDNDLLFLIRDRAAPMVLLPWSTYAELVSRQSHPSQDGASLLVARQDPLAT
jgi:Holliday junction resolvase